MASLELANEPTTLLLYGTEIAVVSRAPAPPGARLDAATIAEDGARSSFRIKVHRCKRQPDGSFVIVGVTLDLRREARAVLEELARTAPGLAKGI